MKRTYIILAAAIPLLLWILSKGGSQESRESKEADSPAAPPTKPAEAPASEPPAERAPAAEAPAAEAPAAEAPAAEAPAAEAPAAEAPAAEAPAAEAPAEEAPAAEAPAAEAPAAEAPAAEAPAAEGGQEIVLRDAKDHAFPAALLEIDARSVRVRSQAELPDHEKVRLILPFGDQSLTLNGQLTQQSGDVLSFKILTMKPAQKKRFEDYLQSREQ